MNHEQLDIEDHAQLLDYLRAAGRIGGERKPAIRTLAGGVSNRTVLVDHGDGSGWVIKQALPKLRVRADWFSDPSRAEREALGIRWLSELAPAGSIPPLVFQDPAQHLLAMEAVPQPHANWKALLLAGQVELEHAEQFGELLGTIHRKSAQRRDELEPVFRDTTFFESLRLEPYYLYTAERVAQARAFLERLVEQTRARRVTLVHGDYSPKNVLVRDRRLILLDHEVIHWGDPAFDLGFSLAHLLSKAHHVRAARERFLELTVRYWSSYGETIGQVPWRAELEEHAVRHTLGCLLARVAGRSPLEYLDEDERQRQREIVIELMRSPPARVQDLLEQFGAGISRHVQS